jgi:2-oxo-4-hydroxy-4-carboxy-5-ureidoimidazoline decarboxylase
LIRKQIQSFPQVPSRTMAAMAQEKATLSALNGMASASFVAELAALFERAPWVAEAAAPGRPYGSVTALHDAMIEVVRRAPPERQLALIKRHPELGSRVRQVGFTGHSQTEQGELGLDRLGAEEFDRFNRLNSAYRQKFGFPFIICVRRHTRASILRQFEARLAHDAQTEHETALTEIGLIARLRLVAKIEGPGVPVTTGRLSTHVLDLTTGRPAAGMAVTLHEIGDSARGLLRQTVTHADGRTDPPLIAGEPLRIGSYELSFDVGGYFQRTQPAALLFLGVVPIRFNIAEPEEHYHVPLLMTPWSYTTYRGN